MGKIAWTNEAQRWLDDIFEYITAENPQAAVRTVQEIYRRVQVLVSHPEIGHRYRDSARNVRVLLYGHYRIAYLVKRDGDIDILGIFHGAPISQNINCERNAWPWFRINRSDWFQLQS
ncbi:MAG: type II toxin-antitoxin system RelE/ParE family toxin [Gammaproteobacteria bacterium]